MFGWEFPPYNSGGLGTACLGLTQGLASLGMDIRFVVPKLFGEIPYSHLEFISAADSSDPEEIEKFLAMDTTVQELASRALAYGNTLTIDEKKRIWVDGATMPVSPNLQARWYAHQARRIARKHTDADVIHSHDWFTYYGGMEARNVAEKMGKTIPFVAQVHATEIDRCGSNGDKQIIEIEHKGLHAADRVVAVSHYTKEVIHQNYGIPRSKISVVYNGIPSEKTHVSYDFQELKKHHKIVLFMGRITYQKGPDYFVKLAKAVTDADPSVLFVMVGTGDMEKRCIEESARLGLTGKMLFSTFLRGADIDRAYQLADLFVMPSVSEPFGIVALEAIQNGTPVIVSKQSGAAEVSDHFMKVDFWDTKGMTDAVLQVVHDDGLASRMKHGGQEDLKHLSWNAAAQSLQAVYESIRPTQHTPILIPA